MTDLRPLTADDAPAVQDLAARAFEDLGVRQGRPPRPGTTEAAEHYTRQNAHLLRTGTGVGAVQGDRLVGAAVSYRRGDLWVLSLLVVDPGAQSGRTGSTLLAEVLRDAPPRRLLHATGDARAMRAYARAGFRLLPALGATGEVEPDPSAPAVREAPDDRPALDPLRPDLEVFRSLGGRVLELADGRPGVALLHRVAGRGSGVSVLSAADDATAADLLRGALALVTGPVEVGPLAPQEHWAVPVLLDAGLRLEPTGPVAVAGPGDPLAGPCAPAAVFV